MARFCYRDPDTFERYIHHARHPRTACPHHHALHPHHGATVCITAHFKGKTSRAKWLLFLFGISTNEERTCYTGALCGLGWNSHTKEAILPEQDIELAFDVKFDVEDVIEVRKRHIFAVMMRMMMTSTFIVSITSLLQFPCAFVFYVLNSDKRSEGSYEPSDLRRGEWHLSSFVWQDQPATGRMPGAPHRVNLMRLHKSVV